MSRFSSNIRPVERVPTALRSVDREYVYDPLPENQRSIRLLNLLAASADAEVECELFPISKEELLGRPYEALSWAWGDTPPKERITIRKPAQQKGARQFKFIKPDLLAALVALRHETNNRLLWVDVLCINQEDPFERNHQVGMMSEIYGEAWRVCIWLGPATTSSSLAISFIKDQVLKLRNFDELCAGPQASEKWDALFQLMHRHWFSRRWVVQELALARQATVYCGRDRIPWEKFAIAVELFVEMESDNHRLSQIIKDSPSFYHVPGKFENISASGASLLVDATNKIFRGYWRHDSTDLSSSFDTDEEGDSDRDDDAGVSPNLRTRITSEFYDVAQQSDSSIQHTLRQPLLTLEHLVSSSYMFNVGTPHDAIYALLSVAKDTSPFAIQLDHGIDRSMIAVERLTQRKLYKVDYRQEFTDVCKDFVEFCVRGSDDPLRALDIICRPWAPEVTNSPGRGGGLKRKRTTPNLSESPSKRTARTQSVNRPGMQMSDGLGRYTPWLREQAVLSRRHRLSQLDRSERERALPSWVPSLALAPFTLEPSSGIHEFKLNRKNADPLIGLPPSDQFLGRNYNASKPKGIDFKSFRFLQRERESGWSMLVKGFVLDVILEVQQSSQGGAIPREWAIAGGWDDVPNSPPPDDFWRTLVAGRSRDGRNPPAYYSTACRETFSRGGIASGLVNTQELIHHERSSLIANFCRHVQAVIWGRSLVTTETYRLGLVGQAVRRNDLICILYGCSVPVVLRQIQKDEEDVVKEMAQGLNNLRHRILTAFVQRRLRKKRLQSSRLVLQIWIAKLYQRWRSDRNGLRTWTDRFARTKYRPLTEGSFYHVAEVVDDGGSQSVVCTREAGSVKKLLEWKAFRYWKRQQRKNLDPRMLRREEQRECCLQVRYWKLWRRTINSRKADSRGPSSAPVPTRPASKEPPPESYIQRFEDKFMARYNMRRAPSSQLGWEPIDRHNLRLGEPWFYYESFGECYLHGMMDGEALAYQTDNRIKPKVFDLR